LCLSFLSISLLIRCIRLWTLDEKANTIQPPFLCFSHLHFMCDKSKIRWQQSGLWSLLMVVFDIDVGFTSMCLLSYNTWTCNKSKFSVWPSGVYGSIETIKVWNNVTETTQVICARAGSLLTSWRNANIWLQLLTTKTSKRLQTAQAQLQETSYAPEHNQETSIAQAQLQETSIKQNYKENVWGWTLDIQSVVFSIQIRYRLVRL